ncbi:MAG TPA: glycoside hydrolase family 16 protein [Phenylobacterium sp.]|uniref:glycoside hydrolase family 16 protein n=1 Tax=Phenylobacterium sp. TaxID=1871053 RepID=UPI002B490BDE|nr:glycoside hydrolase family 16 protein [Phenylobacterium sp.]HKR87503.1 glycoside hydrolase family 16 protein [Phenylobacterium sp.]
MYDCSQTLERRERPRRFGAALLAGFLALSLTACLKVSAPAAAAPTGPLQQAPDGRRLQMTFEDEFDSFRPWRNGHGVWRTVFKDGRADDPELRTLTSNHELQLYVDPYMPIGVSGGEAAQALDPFVVKNGVLDIVARPTPRGLTRALGGFAYTSGLITTQPSFSQTYGYFEMRARLPRGKGVWPAFWLLPADLSWPPEIDVMESIGDPAEVYTTAHSNVDKTPTTKTEISSEGFHTFAVTWDRRNIVWYVDGREVKRQPTPSDMHKPMYMLANVAVGGDWPGAPDATTPFPARMSIDYIRAYRFAP